VSLFDAAPVDEQGRPLAERMRPERLEDFVGQEHILGPGKPLRAQIESDRLTSIILWVRRALEKRPWRNSSRITPRRSSSLQRRAQRHEGDQGGDGRRRAQPALGYRTVLFIDEIHRFNKAQQDAFLPYVERGDVILIGATTENPSFEVISALLSRSKVYALRPLTVEETVTLLGRALPRVGLTAAGDLLEQIAIYAGGDARAAYNLLEIAAAASTGGVLDRQAVEDAMQRRTLLYDKGGEEHYNLISALHKSVRSSDPDAALYWLARMLEAGEDRMYLVRRLVRMAIEDIGLADPRAVEQAIACMQTVHFWESRKATRRWRRSPSTSPSRLNRTRLIRR